MEEDGGVVEEWLKDVARDGDGDGDGDEGEDEGEDGEGDRDRAKLCTPGPFNFNHYFPAQVETDFEDEGVEVVVEEERYDGDIPANLEEDDDFEDHNDTTLRAIPLGDLEIRPAAGS
ncbi:hypothetical protein H0H87_012785 [Tephrocybe sp. NHM501043]|nr:hypothetical protein H0H87_012785 [Tephrocybe sp. NHM501043]